MTSQFTARALPPMVRLRPLPSIARHDAKFNRSQVRSSAMRQTRKPVERLKKTETVEYKLIFAAAFTVFFVAATLEKLSPLKWITSSEGESARKSIFASAREAASISAGYAFMG